MVSRNYPGKRLFDGVKNAGRSEVIGAIDPVTGLPVYAPPASFPPPVTLIDIGADDAEGENVLIYLDTTQENGPDIQHIDIGVDPTVVGYQPYIIAQLEWGVDGYQSQAEVDFVRGTALSLSASYVRVKAAVNKDAYVAIGGPVPFVPVRTAAFAMRGTRPTHLHGPTLTQFFRNVPAGVLSDPQQIPRFSRSISLPLPTRDFPPPNYRIEVLDSNNGIVCVTFANGANQTQDTRHTLLPIDARLVRVFNAFTEPLTFRLIHHLAF